MTVKRTAHTVYDTEYPLVWAPKFRKWILRGDIQERVKSIFEDVVLNHGFAIDAMEFAPDHVHVFLSFSPRYSISKVVGILKSMSEGVFLQEYSEVKKHLWGGKFWEDGYFARTVDDKVTLK